MIELNKGQAIIIKKSYLPAYSFEKQCDRHVITLSDAVYATDTIQLTVAYTIHQQRWKNLGVKQIIGSRRNVLADNFNPLANNFDPLADNFDPLAGKKCPQENSYVA